jgi:hypothetical protein
VNGRLRTGADKGLFTSMTTNSSVLKLAKGLSTVGLIFTIQ